MLKKTLLKNTNEFLQKRFPENLSLKKKLNKKKKNLLTTKGINLKNTLLRFKRKKLKILELQSKNIPIKTFFSSEDQVQSFDVTKWSLSCDTKKNQNTFWLFALPFALQSKGTNQKQKNNPAKYNDFLFSMYVLKTEFEKRQTRDSHFKNKLKEKKKLSILYGNLSMRQIQKNLEKAFTLSGNTCDNLILILESRLDIILYRALFFPSIESARQWIRHNKIYVNSKCVTVPSYIVKCADIISIQKKSKKSLGKSILQFFLRHKLYSENFSSSKNSNFNNDEIKNNYIFLPLGRGSSLPKISFFNEKKKNVSKNIFNLNNVNLIKTITKQINLHSKKLKMYNFNYTKLSFLLASKAKALPLALQGKKAKPFFCKAKSKAKAQKYEIHNFIKENFANKKKFIYNKTQIIQSYNIKILSLYTYFQNIAWKISFKKFSDTTKKSVSTENTLMKLDFQEKSFLISFFPCQASSVDKIKQSLILSSNKVNTLFKNKFIKKNYFVISNFYFEKIQNQIKPLNEFLLKKSIEKLFKIFSVFLKTRKQSSVNSVVPYNFFLQNLKNKNILFKINSLLKSQILFLQNKGTNEFEFLLSNINTHILKKTKEILHSLLDQKNINAIERNFYIQNIVKLNSIEYYDILTFLRLKSFFFKKRLLVFSQENKKIYNDQLHTEKLFKKIHFKPLNLEISYKTLTIIYLYPSQKILFPCTLDLELLVKK